MTALAARRWQGLATSLALVTAALGLGTAGLTLKSEADKAAEIAQGAQREAEAAKARAAEREAEARAAICRSHLARLETVEMRFQRLSDARGSLLSLMEHCQRQSEPDTRNGCLAVVCGTAFLATDGGSNCLAVRLETETIRRDLGLARGALTADQCPVPASPAAAYLEGT